MKENNKLSFRFDPTKEQEFIDFLSEELSYYVTGN